jgi:hypothetical protein
MCLRYREQAHSHMGSVVFINRWSKNNQFFVRYVQHGLQDLSLRLSTGSSTGIVGKDPRLNDNLMTARPVVRCDAGFHDGAPTPCGPCCSRRR